MPGWTSARPEPVRGHAVGVPVWLRWLALGLLWWALGAAPALAREPELQQFQLRRTADAVQLTVRLGLELTPAVEDVLHRGVPLYFVWQAEVFRERWYWTNKRVSRATRVLRLAYQPLTRRWRLSVSNEVGGGAGASLPYALHQNHDSLETALASISRMTHWTVANSVQMADGGSHLVEWRFRLDPSLLPRPFQLGIANQEDWVIDIRREVEIPAPGAHELKAAEPGEDGGEAADESSGAPR